MVTTTEYNLSVKQFYDTFIGDDASYTLTNFHKHRGDWDVSTHYIHII